MVLVGVILCLRGPVSTAPAEGKAQRRLICLSVVSLLGLEGLASTRGWKSNEEGTYMTMP